MNKLEIAEIRKQWTKEKATFDRICACYVDDDKTKTYVGRDAFFSLPEEEIFKYLEIFQKATAGQIGRNLVNLEFPREEEMEGGAQAFLLKLRNSALSDDALLDQFYDLVIANYETAEKYYIVLAHAVYDIPGKSTAGDFMEDASDNLYDYMICAICPVKLSKPGLGYNEAEGRIGERKRDWVVEEPDKAFLFPAYTDRTANIHEVLYYSHKPEELMPEFSEALFGKSAPASAGTQKELFDTLVAESLGEEATLATVQAVQEEITEILEANKDQPEPPVLGKGDIRRLLSRSGVSDEQLEQAFDRSFDELAGSPDEEIVVTNLAAAKRFTVKTPDIDIHVKPESAGLIENKMVEGQLCIVIPITGDIEVNGIPVRAAIRTGEE